MHKLNLPKTPVDWLRLLGVAALYGLTAALVSHYFEAQGRASVFYLASGVALAALLIGGPRYFWAVFLGSLVKSLLGGVVWWGAAGSALGSALAALVGAWLIRRNAKFDPDLPTLRDVASVFLWGGAVACGISALIGSTSLLLRGVVEADAFLISVVNWWMGDAFGVVLLTPLLLVWWTVVDKRQLRPKLRELPEAALVIGSTAVAGGVVFMDWGHGGLTMFGHLTLDTVAQGYWMFLFVAWAALRLGQRGTTLALLMAAVMGASGIVQGKGFISGNLAISGMTSYWFYMLTLAAVGLALATYVTASKRAAERLARSEARISMQYTNALAALDLHSIVATTDVQGRILSANDKFCQVSGYSREELLGQDHILLNSGTHPHGFFKQMYRTLATGQPWQGEVCNRAKDGHLYWLQTTVTPFMGKDGKPTMYVAIRTDISGRKRTEQELRHSEERLQVATRSGGIGIWDWDLKTNTLTWDDMMLALYGLQREGFSGAIDAWQAGIHPDDVEAQLLAMQAAIAGAGLFDSEFRVLHLDGSIRHLKANADVVRDAQGQALRMVGVSRDITASKQAEGNLRDQANALALANRELDLHQTHLEELVLVRTEELKKSHDAAHAANRSKSEFLANMSHEIRTPMNGVIGMVDILQQTALSTEQARMLDTIHDSSMALLSILNDILDFSKIEAGKLEVESMPTHLREVAEGVAQLMLNVAGAKNAQISLFVDPALPTWVMSDPTRLRQVLFNLLGNALKFIPKGMGRALLHVHPIVRPDGVACVQFSIIDNGIGMSEEVVAKLFQPFTQADASTARKFGGTGLGLSITQRLVELMHGRISVISTPGAGSEFTVEFPLQAALAPSGRAPSSTPDLRGVRVLAVTPLASCSTLFQVYLGAAGAQVSVVPDLTTAHAELAHRAAQQPGDTVLLLDLEEEGDEANDTLPWPAGVRVVRLVNRADSQAPVPPAQAFDIRVLARPLLHHDLLHGVAVACGRISATHTSQFVERRLRPRFAAPGVEEAAKSGCLILLAEDNETNRDVMGEQLRLLGYAVEMAYDGALALEMWQGGQRSEPARYTLLLTDCHMPNMDGFELTAAIRSTESAGKRLPIIAITANAMQGEAQRCRERGMDDYLSKPLRLGELGPMLAKWMPEPVPLDDSGADAPRNDEVERVVASEARQSISPQVVAPDWALWNPATLTELVGDNPAVHKRLLVKFLQNANEQVTSIGAAAAAGNAKEAAGLAHTLKSAARSVGALALGELCQAIETAGNAGDAPACSALVPDMAAAFAVAALAINHHLAP